MNLRLMERRRDKHSEIKGLHADRQTDTQKNRQKDKQAKTLLLPLKQMRAFI